LLLSPISFKKRRPDVKSNRICNTSFFSKDEAVKSASWLLLLFSLPTNRNTERVAVWRRLKKMGAVQIKTSTYLLPDEPAFPDTFAGAALVIVADEGTLGAPAVLDESALPGRSSTI